MLTPARTLLVLLLLLVPTAACSAAGSAPPAVAPSTATSGPTTAGPTTTRSSARPTPTPTPTATASATRARAPSLRGDRRNQIAFARLDDPGRITVEGRVEQTEAWSTSKVLVVAAYLDTAVGGDPTRLSRRNRQLVEAALSRSDADAVVAVRAQIPGRPGPAMTQVLRDIGDDETVAPDQSQGLMRWSAREQVRFMAALAGGRVVSKASSAYLLDVMHPVREHAWGLGTIGASAFKGGWLRADTVTRQMGLVDGYAVAILTTAGPAVRQSDGDDAHVRQMDRLAALLRARLEAEDQAGR